MIYWLEHSNRTVLSTFQLNKMYGVSKFGNESGLNSWEFVPVHPTNGQRYKKLKTRCSQLFPSAFCPLPPAFCYIRWRSATRRSCLLLRNFQHRQLWSTMGTVLALCILAGALESLTAFIVLRRSSSRWTVTMHLSAIASLSQDRFL